MIVIQNIKPYGTGNILLSWWIKREKQNKTKQDHSILKTIAQILSYHIKNTS